MNELSNEALSSTGINCLMSNRSGGKRRDIMSKFRTVSHCLSGWQLVPPLTGEVRHVGVQCIQPPAKRNRNKLKTPFIV